MENNNKFTDELKPSYWPSEFIFSFDDCQTSKMMITYLFSLCLPFLSHLGHFFLLNLIKTFKYLLCNVRNTNYMKALLSLSLVYNSVGFICSFCSFLTQMECIILTTMCLGFLLMYHGKGSRLGTFWNILTIGI